jgi:hypothetical protein
MASSYTYLHRNQGSSYLERVQDCVFRRIDVVGLAAAGDCEPALFIQTTRRSIGLANFEENLSYLALSGLRYERVNQFRSQSAMLVFRSNGHVFKFTVGAADASEQESLKRAFVVPPVRSHHNRNAN